MGALSSEQKPTQRVKEHEEKRNVFQTEEQHKYPETDLSEMEISDLPDRDFKITIIKMLIKIRRPMHDEQSENFKQRDRKYKKEPNRNHRTDCNGNQYKAGVTILISDKTDFKTKDCNERQRRSLCRKVIIKGSIHQ